MRGDPLLGVGVEPFDVGVDFAVIYLDGSNARFVTSEGSERLASEVSGARFDQSGWPHVRRKDEWQRVEGADWSWSPSFDATAAIGRSASALESDHWDEAGCAVEEWASVSWRSGDQEFVLSVADPMLKVGEIDEQGAVRWLHTATGVSERASAPSAIAVSSTGSKLHIYVADGSWIRVYDESLNLVTQIGVSGGPASKLAVHTVRLDGTIRAAFALVCESGLIAGELFL